MGTWAKSLSFIFFFFLIANLIYIDIKLFFSKTKNTSSLPILTEPINIPSSTSPVPFQCIGSCEEFLNKKINDATASVVKVLQNKPLGGKEEPIQIYQTISHPSVKEFYIPLGAGNTSSRDWQDIAGSDTVIDTNKYPSMKNVYFEVSLSVPTNSGTAFARLFNVTDKHPAWFAEVQTDSSQSVLLKSNPIILDQGNKTYRVQLKSSIGAQVIMDLARVKIVIE